MSVKKILMWIAACVGAVCAVVAGAVIRYSAEAPAEKWLFITENGAAESEMKGEWHNFSSRVNELLAFMQTSMAQHPGAYKIEKGCSAIEVAQRIRRGAQTPVRFTFNNVRTLDQLAEKISEKMKFSKEEFMEALGDSIGLDCFLPDTYETYWTYSANRVIKMLQNYHDKWWTTERLAKADKLGLSTKEVATVASIVEEETNKRDERATVAALYLNRLRIGMPLQADPTIKFALGDFSLRRITNKHLSVESPYNTYKNAGLPPAPIRIPEKSTLDAVLNAPRHQYLYMCAKEDFSGYHNFTASFAEHQRNARRYQSALNRRGIK